MTPSSISPPPYVSRKVFLDYEKWLTLLFCRMLRPPAQSSCLCRHVRSKSILTADTQGTIPSRGGYKASMAHRPTLSTVFHINHHFPPSCRDDVQGYPALDAPSHRRPCFAPVWASSPGPRSCSNELFFCCSSTHCPCRYPRSDERQSV